ncbi:LVIVD repeat-containing protein [Micromonospora echinaurantiaca]|uniref:LVIVD repeat-containing protein n=1 Tax=Micromonospora echinaurantiaca TaxID=47857 RepID=UPI00371F8019
MLLIATLPGTAAGQEPGPDPRIDLGAGWLDAQSASSNLDLLAHHDKPAGFVNPANPGDFGFAGSDLAFGGTHAFMGNFNGFNIYDISQPANPTLVTSVVCPGGQGDLSVHGNLLFMSVEESRGRVDCGTNPAAGTRFQGVRVFDISDVANPVQVAAVQTCRGSHTHTLVTDPDDSANVYVYVSGTAGVRPASTMAGCNNVPASGEDPARWRIDVIKVPVAHPEQAAIVSGPRLFADPETGAVDGLQNTPPAPRHPSGGSWSPSPVTDACHDITAYPELGLAAGACEGNGILIDISDPANPVRIDEVADPNFAYWHSATLSNDGKKVIFTDEWGGGTGARCRTTDQPQWGANAIFDIVDGKMRFASYYKLPVPQTLQENCVAHNGSLIPVPGRDILAQAWYQGGISLLDFTDSANPREIGYFDRGPISPTALMLGGFWSAYWYNGQVYGSEIARGFDVFGLRPSEHLTEAEIAAAREVQLPQFNAQLQTRISWAPSFAVARARFDQLLRTCTTTVANRHNGPLTVTGVTCLTGATVSGPVTVRPGATLLAIDSSISGPVSASNAAAVHLYHSTVRGPVSVTGTTGSAAIVDTEIHGPAVLTGGTGTVEPIVADSTVRGPLACTGNAPAPINLGVANTVHGPATGQCAGLD